MKKKIISGILLATVILFVACKPETKDIGNHYAAGDGIIGSWVLTNVEQTDLSLPLPETHDISHFFTSGDTWEFTFKADSTYTVDMKGPGPDIFGSQGNWKFDKYPFPTMIIMGDTDSTTFANGLLNMPRENDMEFGFEFTRYGCEKDIVTYSYKFTRK